MSEHTAPSSAAVDGIDSNGTTTHGDGYHIGKRRETIVTGRREDRTDPATAGTSPLDVNRLADGRPVVGENARNRVTDPKANASAEPTGTDTTPAPRTRRAYEEEMDVSLLRKGGIYEVRSESGNTYEDDVAASTCTCLDWQRHESDGGCKHLRRADMAIKAGTAPRPDGRIPERSIGDGCRDDFSVATANRIIDRIHALDAAIERQRAERRGVHAALAMVEAFRELQRPVGLDGCETD